MGSQIEPRQLNKLCQKCQQIFPVTGLWPWERRDPDQVFSGGKQWHLRDLTIDELDESATTDGCHLCRVFLDSLIPIPKLIILTNCDGYTSWREDVKTITFYLRLVNRDHDPDNYNFSLDHDVKPSYGGSSIDLKPVTPKDSPFQPSWVIRSNHLPYGYKNSPSPVTIFQPSSTTNFDPLALEQIRSWIHDCTHNHEACRGASLVQNSMAEFLEKVRFIDVGLDDTATVRLVERIKDTNVKYITLSYRWTVETPKTNLKTHNKDKYHQSIPTENWPQIYKDAVALSRTLGIRYVWIDSLCIIQDDGKDWNTQASLMHRIYTHGYLNLAHACAEFSPGLEVTRDPISVSPCVLSRTRTASSSEYWACFVNYTPSSDLARAPLYSRGWCYQERFLATRTVHFSQQLYWECKAGHASESFTGDKGLAWSRGSASSNPDILTSVDQANDQRFSTVFGVSTVWQTIVRDYSQTQLTQYSDRLAALRGVFNRFWEILDASQERDWCVAGLWKKYLIRQLIWYRVSHRHGHYDEFERIRDTAYYASFEKQLAGFPSWSWASCPTSPGSSSIAWPGHTEPEYQNEPLVEIETIIPLNSQALHLGYPGFESSALVLRTAFGFFGFDAEQLLSKWESWFSTCKADARAYNGDKCQFQVLINLDRPIIGVVEKEDLRLLPISMEYQAGRWDTVWIEGILLEEVGVEDDLPTFRRMGQWSHRYDMDTCTQQSPIPGLLGSFDTKERLEIELGEFRKRRELLPFRRYKLV
ncbi:HET-domain-containing protein [Neurospora crassa]|uniref:Heterokaryon incompatibility domain-containing protein n=1 Tax=Neurospora crassa (strain ATCC 24698 / 74-OR23-1A / CBS 708.71 / DSM 1257 / FGSC 987) TaxID=367110 RepID=F5HD25_NEUCR|nr:hypothetical protein NCU06806 [Neurospora crassa OR74A]EAA34411.3 hypothetical protein NCU06806 [Neurospora crassa OR74A]KHE87624.1 HET-domain-containing protein [Neurospora crassa]|eukprot:XP_963647.3 hypothetical protein NCU06806 [Neurospora crassa OR74A]